MKTNSSKESGLAGRSLGRRDLLKLGATSAVVPVVLGPTAIFDKGNEEQAGQGVANELSAGPFALGYWNGAASSSIVDAHSMASGDPAFARFGAKIAMIGMADSGTAAASCGLDCLEVDLQIGASSYRTWSFAASPVLNVSSPSTYAVPVDKATGLHFSLRSLMGHGKGNPRTANLKLTTGGGARAAKLQAGYYVLAIGNNGHGFRINWAAHRISGDGTGQSLVLRREGAPVRDVPYLIFSVTLNSPGTQFV